MHGIFRAAVFSRHNEEQKRSKSPSVHEWMGKLHYLYTMEHSLTMRKSNTPHVNVWMTLKPNAE